MRKSELIAKLQPIDGDPEVAIHDIVTNLIYDEGEGSSKAIYKNFDVSLTQNDEIPEGHEPWIALTFYNEYAQEPPQNYSKDFRIGNKIIFVPDDNEVIDVDVNVLKDVINNPANYRIIQLSRKWLEWMGFTVQTFEGEDAALVSLEGLFNNTPFYQKDHALSVSSAPLARPIKFVHELQNYFFDLTGKELTIEFPFFK